MRKYCDEIKKYLPHRAAGDRTDRQDGEEALPRERTGGRLFSRVRKAAMDFGAFKKRFEPLLAGRGATRISFSLDALVDSIVRQCRQEWSGVAIRYRNGPGIKPFCSPEELGLCLRAVLANACESLARRDDGITISAGEDEITAFLEVTDEGAGIPLKHLRFAGRPFFTTKRNHDGLGLFITRILMERNGGSCTLKPGSERGTTVTLRVPKGKATDAAKRGLMI